MVVLGGGAVSNQRGTHVHVNPQRLVWLLSCVYVYIQIPSHLSLSLVFGGGGNLTRERERVGSCVSRTATHETTSARYRAVTPSSGSNVIPRRARPGLAALGRDDVGA